MRQPYLLCLMALFGTSLLQGCLVVKTPQVETVKMLAKSVFDQTSTGNREQSTKWTARVGDEGRLVEVVEQDGFFVFVSSAGDAIAFDGWNIRSIIGFGDTAARVIALEGEQKQFRNGNALSSTICSQWQEDLGLLTGRSKVWVQQCESQRRANSIKVDGNGAITEISQAIDTEGNRAVLRRL